jgi:HK97 family phage major capsid protein
LPCGKVGLFIVVLHRYFHNHAQEREFWNYLQMKSIKEYDEILGEISRSIVQVADKVTQEERTYTPEEQKQCDHWEQEKSRLEDERNTVERVERSRQYRKTGNAPIELSRPTDTLRSKDIDNVFRAWALNRIGCDDSITRSMFESVEKTGFNLQAPGISFENIVRTGLAIGTTGSGAELQDGSIFGGISVRLKAYGGIEEVCSHVKTPHGNPWSLAKLDDTGNVATISAENGTIGDQDLGTAKITLGAYRINSGEYPVSVEMLEDSAVELTPLIGSFLGTRIGRARSNYLTNGTGSSQPTGFLTSSTNAVTAAGTTAVTYAELMQLYHALDPDYRDNAVWMMHDLALSMLEQVLDGNDRPILYSLLDGLNNQAPAETIKRKRVVINQQMPVPTAGNVAIAFGDFTNFYCRDVGERRLFVDPYTNSKTGQVNFLAWDRMDSGLGNDYAIQTLTMAAS